MDDNPVENHIRQVVLGRANWPFTVSLHASRRAAAVMSLLHSARLNGHDPYAELRDGLERLPTQPTSRIGELLPHRWQVGHRRNVDVGRVGARMPLAAAALCGGLGIARTGLSNRGDKASAS